MDVDLLLSDALSMPIITAFIEGFTEAGLDRNVKIFADITDYHAHVDSVVRLSEEANVQLTALYHLVPPPQNAIMSAIFTRGLPSNVMLSEDRMWFRLAVGSSEIDVD